MVIGTQLPRSNQSIISCDYYFECTGWQFLNRSIEPLIHIIITFIIVIHRAGTSLVKVNHSKIVVGNLEKFIIIYFSMEK